MKYLLRIFIFSSLLISTTQSRAQVTGVQYALLFNQSTHLFDCFIYIEEGQAKSVLERVQFNAQYSLVIPTGAKVEIVSNYMPLIDNQKFLGRQPMKWTVSSKLISPEVLPEFDFYGITPNLAPAGFYNMLESGDIVKLFSLKIEGKNIDLNQVRIFSNESDPKSIEQGMQSGDFSNGFTMGSYKQIFKGIKLITEEFENYTTTW